MSKPWESPCHAQCPMPSPQQLDFSVDVEHDDKITVQGVEAALK